MKEECGARAGAPQSFDVSITDPSVVLLVRLTVIAQKRRADEDSVRFQDGVIVVLGDNLKRAIAKCWAWRRLQLCVLGTNFSQILIFLQMSMLNITLTVSAAGSVRFKECGITVRFIERVNSQNGEIHPKGNKSFSPALHADCVKRLIERFLRDSRAEDGLRARFECTETYKHFFMQIKRCMSHLALRRSGSPQEGQT